MKKETCRVQVLYHIIPLVVTLTRANCSNPLIFKKNQCIKEGLSDSK